MIHFSSPNYKSDYFSKNHVSGTARKIGVTFIWWFTFHHNGEILTEKILHANRFTHPVFVDEGKHVYHISWSSFVYLLEGIIRKEKDEYFDEENDEGNDGNEHQNAV